MAKHQHPNMSRADQHDRQIAQLDSREHLTKKSGGIATHGVNYKGEHGAASADSVKGAIDKKVDNAGVGAKPKQGSGHVKP